ncbi:RING zinc finger-containing protein [Heterostelium album PN500]|uniref:RING zinc finger-containing protein n=1 Tax=Heterostelium pallidum (strain ATCC 26659 / Pp 5 / PN500) TaxID=670386 RepID=D3BKF7_HETP5|nr:RING zinc finger-containing protein [Heterostelium album PN500]EFA78387.1 RING zinc finger-containing protein [Heterostelium album PN500]|eukprot:XP_020430512.1 RING zinc finger-containing protein [Heterostelium album PN500]
MTDIEKDNNDSNDNNVGTTTTEPKVIFKRQQKNRNIRKRDISSTILQDNNSNSETSEESTTKENDIDTTSSSSAAAQDNNDNDNGQEEGGSTSITTKKQKVVVNQYTTKNVTKTDHSYSTTGSAKPMMSEADSSATLIEREDNIPENTDKESINNDDGIYRGMKSYNNYIEKKSDLTYKGAGVKAGPIKITTSNYKTSVRFDYQPDVCKDYKQTGQCSFGDTCKFLHDRSDYKAGWQVEREYEAEQKQKKKDKESEKERGFKDTEEEELPFACFICRKPFENPVMTK